MEYTYNQQSNQQASTNLDQDLKNSRNEKFTRGEVEAREWIFEVLTILPSVAQEHKQHGSDLIDILKDGKILCQLGNLLNLPGTNPCSKYKNSKMPFVQMENISFFLKACEMIGVPHDEIFQTVDLFERKDPYQVIVTLISFSRKAHVNNPKNFPKPVGPKIVKIKPPVPVKPVNLRK
ncbi:transgelin [[Candida] anglica]|uniref:Transgelin n=1 Tax=[Candida] anglica TaxID=148631 RepID=A0ABP0ED15_9ASCO